MVDQSIRTAHDVVGDVLEHDPRRLHHCAGVASRVEMFAATVPEDAAETLVAAAWLHDIGYATAVRHSGYHPIDGARYLRREGWPKPVCDLVAHHSGSRFVAHVLGLDRDLAEFDFVEDPLTDALTAADNTAGPNGTVM